MSRDDLVEIGGLQRLRRLVGELGQLLGQEAEEKLQVRNIGVARQRLRRGIDGVNEIEAHVRQLAQRGAGQQLQFLGAFFSVNRHIR